MPTPRHANPNERDNDACRISAFAVTGRFRHHFGDMCLIGEVQVLVETQTVPAQGSVRCRAWLSKSAAFVGPPSFATLRAYRSS